LKSHSEISEYKEPKMWTAELTIELEHAKCTFSDDNFKNASSQAILEVI
jgi:hypothetical protein